MLAYPDGLRGVAAFFVVIHHSSLLWWTWEIHKGWGVESPANNWLALFIRLPIIRLAISGLPNVCVFFVISGYAISHKPLRLIRQGHFSAVAETLSSSIFRRHSRLFMPAAIITFCTAVMAQIDRNWFINSNLATAVPQRIILSKDTLYEQLEVWWAMELNHTKPLNHGIAQEAMANVFNDAYDFNLWTLPIEFASSMVIFLILVAFSRLRSRARMLFVFVALVYVEYYFVLWAIFLFLGGMLICDLRLELDGRGPSAPGPNGGGGGIRPTFLLPRWARGPNGSVLKEGAPGSATKRVGRSNVHYACGFAALTFSLWLLSTPEVTMGGKESWTYATMTSSVIKPYDDFVFIPLGAILLVLTIDQVSFIQGFFTSRLAQYLGRISYSLYLVHGPLLWSLGIKMGRMMLTVTGWGTPLRYCLGVLMGMFLWLLVVIYIADLTHRYIDEQCVAFGKWVYNKLAVKEQ